MPFGIQPFHILVVIVVALIIFGPKHLPEIGRGLGKAITEFRKGSREMKESFQEEVAKKEGIEEPAPGAPTPSAGTSRAESLFCVKCGHANPSEAKFCNKCGAQMPA
jgi:sec-independent protein translocase protein TatA